MIIPLDDKTRIRGTELAWQLESLKNNGEWRPTKYFQTIGHALHEAAWREIRLYPAETLAEAIQAVDTVAARYSQTLDEALATVKIRAQNPKVAS